MGRGGVTPPPRQGTTTVADYNLYCYYVAGLVGEGLSRLFVSMVRVRAPRARVQFGCDPTPTPAKANEAPELAADMKLSIEMGTFLQKTNIIRDYLEDYVEGRAFWPKEVRYSCHAGAAAPPTARAPGHAD